MYHYLINVDCFFFLLFDRLTHDLTPESNLPSISPVSCESNEDLYNLDPYELNASNITSTHFNFKYSNEITSNLNKFAKNGSYCGNLNKTTLQCVHCKNSPSKVSYDQCTINGDRATDKNLHSFCASAGTMCKHNVHHAGGKKSDDEDFEACDFKYFRSQLPPPDLLPTRPRRKLPEIPKDKIRKYCAVIENHVLLFLFLFSHDTISLIIHCFKNLNIAWH